MKKKIRKLFNKFNIDIHRYDPSKENLKWLYEYDFKTLLDIGANIGKFSLEVRREIPNVKIFAFEPLKDTYDELLLNFSKYDNFYGYNVALGNNNSNVEFHRSSHLTSSSVLKMEDLHKKAFPESSGVTIENVEMRRLDDLIEQENIILDDNVFTKIDVQGFEYEVLLGGMNTISKSKVIICEVSFEVLYKNQKLYDDVYDLLKKMGFRFIGMLSQIHHPKTGRILQANAIFTKI